MELHVRGSTLVLRGDLDARSTARVRGAVHHLLDAHRDVVVDLGGVENADLTGLRVLALATRRARAEGRCLTLRGCGPAVRRLLQLSRLGRLVRVDRGADPSLSVASEHRTVRGVIAHIRNQ